LSDRTRRYLSHVKDASHFAGQLVDALLDFSRMGRSALKHVAVDLGMLVRDLKRELTLQYPQRRIHWEIDADLPKVWGDAILLQVAVRNLLGNAVKYTRQRDEAVIRVKALRTPEGEGLVIEDNGVGFQMKYVNKLFGVFQRLHQAEEYEGTGIGLASVRRIIERHGGQVTADGVPNEGATFTFTLPRREAGTPPVPTFHDDTTLHRAASRGAAT
jgi:light-regulated signal transduction histidine kinase (bacteriophytochrome)